MMIRTYLIFLDHQMCTSKPMGTQMGGKGRASITQCLLRETEASPGLPHASQDL
jgi:hypothetical protein